LRALCARKIKGFGKMAIMLVETLGFSVIRETYREARQSYKLDLQVNAHTQIELFSFIQHW